MAKKPRSATFIKDPLWYKDAVIYQVHVKSFFDSNNDGIGAYRQTRLHCRSGRQHHLAVAVLPLATT